MAWSGWVNTHKATAGLTENAGTFTGRVGTVLMKPVKWAVKTSADFTVNNAKKVGNAAGHVTAVGTGAAHGLAKSPLGKKLGIAALVVGGLATVGLMIGKSRTPKNDPALDTMPMVAAPEDLQLASASANAAPVNDIPDTNWAQTVVANRGAGVKTR